MIHHNDDNAKSRLKHDLLVATVPALLAIALQKTLDEFFDFFRRRRELGAAQKEESIKKLSKPDSTPPAE